MLKSLLVEVCDLCQFICRYCHCGFSCCCCCCCCVVVFMYAHCEVHGINQTTNEAHSVRHFKQIRINKFIYRFILFMIYASETRDKQTQSLGSGQRGELLGNIGVDSGHMTIVRLYSHKVFVSCKIPRKNTAKAKSQQQQ